MMNKAEKYIRPIAATLLVLLAVVALWFVNYGLPPAKGERAAIATFDTVCAVKWPEPTVQQYHIKKAVGQTNPKATNIAVDITAPGLSVVKFASDNGISEKVIVAFEFMSRACVTSEPYKLADNPLLFRVLSYTK